MNSLLLASSSYSTFGVIIWIIVIGLAIYAIKAIGRFSFGVGVFIAMAFFSIFMLDNYTNHDLRRYIDISTYDETLADPKAKAEDLADKGASLGSDIVGKVDVIGADIDAQVGIGRVDDSKEWGKEDTSENEKDSKKDKNKEQETKDKGTKTPSIKDTTEVMYADIPKLLKGDLKYLSKQDKSIIESMSPTLKITLDGEQMSVSNKDSEDGYLTISLKK